MPPAVTTSNICAFVRWKEQAVYSGEVVECLITFKNVSKRNGDRNGDEAGQSRGGGPLKDKRPSFASSTPYSRRSSIAQSKTDRSRAPSGASARNASLSNKQQHRPALSINVPNPTARTDPQSSTPHSAFKPSGGHGRSLSILSLGAEGTADGRTSTLFGKRPAMAHTRSASLQFTPRSTTQQSPNIGLPSPRQPSPLYESSTPPVLAEVSSQPLPIRPGRQKQSTASMGSIPQLKNTAPDSGQPNVDTPTINFKFPPPQPSEKPAQVPRESSKLAPTMSERPPNSRTQSAHRIPETGLGANSTLNPISRVLSESSISGTPRTSSEFYSVSNHSNETIMSDITANTHPIKLRAKPADPQSRSKNPRIPPAETETLMMAYAQTMGNFVLDGSLVNAAPFEDVKRKGVQGDGGVVGLEKASRSSGIFGGFSWENFGESISGLLGGNELSSMAQMKATVGSKSVPLLSTPQNLLFIDLKLAPGESRTYRYRFSLPRGLPPSYRGRAIKISYHLAIGVQRPGQKTVKHVEVPFRVLGSYDARGNPLGHDLMSPYILMGDAAMSTCITSGSSRADAFDAFPAKIEEMDEKARHENLEDFLRYSERLLNARKDSVGVILSPLTPTPSTPASPFGPSGAEQLPSTIKEAIDVAILRSNQSTSSEATRQGQSQSANRFNIARSGQPVAVLTLLRPAYKLGEAVTGAIDFALQRKTSDEPSQAPTYAVSVALESSEHVDPSLALRSNNSIGRVTRKVYASMRENAIYARQLSFSLNIPSTAPPSFETTGVSLEWRLRIEFITQRKSPGPGLDDRPTEGGNELMEELGSDERGTIYVARERLAADSFEVLVPLRIYGAAGVDTVHSESEALTV